MYNPHEWLLIIVFHFRYRAEILDALSTSNVDAGSVAGINGMLSKKRLVIAVS